MKLSSLKSIKCIVCFVNPFNRLNSLAGAEDAVEIPRRIHLISTPWAPDTGLVTATFKLKRKIIHDRYEEVIKALYSKDF